MSASVAVVGGGPAGLIAAEVLAHAGHRVTVFEQMRSVGRKFLLAGRGGLNISHSMPFDALVAQYGAGADALRPALESFTPDDLAAWCAGLNEPTFAGTSGRLFPASFRATPLLRAWLRRLDDLGVTIETGQRWTGWDEHGALWFSSAAEQHLHETDATVFALGGASWPRVGSDGTWVEVLRSDGIGVGDLEPANCGFEVAWSQKLLARHEGTPLKNVVLASGSHMVGGDIVVTANGLEGGPVYALGSAVRAGLRDGPVTVALDAHRDLSVERLHERLQRRRAKTTATRWLTSAGVAPAVVAVARDATANQLPDSPLAMARLLKAIPIEITALASLNRAISTAGGVRFAALDSNYMLRDKPGTFVAGEMVDWEAPTGGFLLQACFSTGVAAARGVLTWCENGARS